MSLSIVQFPHPGSEPKIKKNDKHTIWNNITKSHTRKFMQLKGKYVLNNELIEKDLWAWGEWEAESLLLKELRYPSNHYPKNLWHPYWVKKNSYTRLHNTDPFIFSGFYYTDCKQRNYQALRNLEHGSLVLFGSKRFNAWVLDTVFVVSDAIRHNSNNYEDVLKNIIPSSYNEVVLQPTYNPPNENGHVKERILYRGIIFNNENTSLYSFFPCIEKGENIGFERPQIEIDEKYFNSKLGQGLKYQTFENNKDNKNLIEDVWNKIKEQVEEKNLKIGVFANLPDEKIQGSES